MTPALSSRTPRAAPRLLVPADPPLAARAALFAAILFAVELAMFRASYYDQNSDMTYLALLGTYEPAHRALHLLAITGSLTLFATFAYVAMRSAPLARTLSVVVFGAGVWLEYGYQGTLQRFSDVADIQPFLLITDLDTKLSAITLYSNAAALLPVAAFAALIWTARPSVRAGAGALLATAVVTVAVHAGASRYVELQAHHQPYPLVAAQATIRTTASHLMATSLLRPEPRVPVPTIAGTRPANNVVLIVDESVRGDHLSVNGYGRSTTPYLSALHARGALANWGLAAAGSTCSGASNDLLMTGLRLTELPDAVDHLRTAPTIFHYAKARGYTTHYFDAQMNVVWNLLPADMAVVDDWRRAAQFLGDGRAPHDVDFAVADAVRAIVTGSSGHFIWVTKGGVHVPYYRRVPESSVAWTPAWTSGRWNPAARDGIVNTYDSALRYNLDEFVRRLLTPDEGVPAATVYLYTADHGESLADNGEAVAHCGVGRQEAVVPLFALGLPRPVDTAYRASHENVFPTVLDLLGVPATAHRRPYARSLLDATGADSQPRHYTGPDLARRHRALPFDDPFGETGGAAMLRVVDATGGHAHRSAAQP
jgi:glucan phosphoethanolaminetransferase (alkaline phosphatase superfamily)